MNSFPIIKIQEVENCFHRICLLYKNDKRKILEATERATVGFLAPYTITADTEDNQINIIKNKVKKTADRVGQNLLIKIVEELYDYLLVNGVVGVSDNQFIEEVFFNLNDDSKINYTLSKTWIWTWRISVDINEREISIGLRDKSFPPGDIVPDHVLQFIQQGIIAFKNNRDAASLALLSIALEGTLKDILDSPAYIGAYGSPSHDVYQIDNMNIYPAHNGYRIEFPNAMPIPHTSYLSNPGDQSHNTVRVKRIVKSGKNYIEIRDVNSIIDYWTSDVIINSSIKTINGLGTAIDIARNHAGILSPVDLPLDIDEVIQTIRNKLVHLSGANLNQVVNTDAGSITIADFIKDKNKVSDTIDSISETINKLYTKLMNGTL